MLWILAALCILVAGGLLLRRFLDAAPGTDPIPEDAGGPDPDYEREIGTELDLHGVPPRQVAELVDEFVRVSRTRGHLVIRIVHGKGTGALRRTVRARLARHVGVIAFGDAAGSGWGATVVQLAPPGAGLEVADDDGSP